MKKTDLSRRDFNRLTVAALSGVAAGSVIGCGGEEPEAGGDGGSGTGEDSDGDGGGDSSAGGDGADEKSLLLAEKHVCRGLNMCKNQGASGDNACAGQGTCATIEHHVCGTKNACKGQGGCGEKPGENACKAQGKCAVPLMEHAWGTARKNFEAAMKADGKTVGQPPEAATKEG